MSRIFDIFIHQSACIYFYFQSQFISSYEIYQKIIYFRINSLMIRTFLFIILKLYRIIILMQKTVILLLVIIQQP